LADFVRGDYHQKFQTDNDAVFLNQTRSINNHNSWQMELKQIRETESTQKLLLWTIDGNMGHRFQYSAAGHTFTEYSAGFEGMLKTFTFPDHRGIRKPTCLLFNLICL
jgi:hypothetical protein